MSTFYIRIKQEGLDWDKTPERTVELEPEKATEFCKNLANLFQAEVRVATSEYGSGNYIFPKMNL